MSNRTRAGDTTDHDPEAGDERLSPDVAAALRDVADRIDGRAESLPIGPARHHARRAAVAARTTADADARLVDRRVAIGTLVTALRTAADEADATRTQYDLLQFLYEDVLPVTRAASGDIYG